LKQQTTYSESDLIERLCLRDEKAFSYLYDNYSAALAGIIGQIIPDTETVNDTLQLVFMNIWKKINSYDPGKGRLFTWMLNIARNAAIDKIRSRSYKESLKNQSLPEDVYSLNNQVTLPGYDDIGLRKLVGRLKDEQKVLIELSYFQGFTHEEISRALNVPLGTVKTRIRSALIQLRKLIGEK